VKWKLVGIVGINDEKFILKDGNEGKRFCDNKIWTFVCILIYQSGWIEWIGKKKDGWWNARNVNINGWCEGDSQKNFFFKHFKTILLCVCDQKNDYFVEKLW
jgi:hypothetical protein